MRRCRVGASSREVSPIRMSGMIPPMKGSERTETRRCRETPTALGSVRRRTGSMSCSRPNMCRCAVIERCGNLAGKGWAWASHSHAACAKCSDGEPGLQRRVAPAGHYQGTRAFNGEWSRRISLRATSPPFLPPRVATKRSRRTQDLQNPKRLATLPFRRRRSQVVRQRSAKPLFVGSIPTGASLSHNAL